MIIVPCLGHFSLVINVRKESTSELRVVKDINSITVKKVTKVLF
jgi:hypothetical protein